MGKCHPNSSLSARPGPGRRDRGPSPWEKAVRAGPAIRNLTLVRESGGGSDGSAQVGLGHRRLQDKVVPAPLPDQGGDPGGFDDHAETTLEPVGLPFSDPGLGLSQVLGKNEDHVGLRVGQDQRESLLQVGGLPMDLQPVPLQAFDELSPLAFSPAHKDGARCLRGRQGNEEISLPI